MEKGNKHDPFLYETYRSMVASNNWNGGWVKYDPPINDIVFIDHMTIDRGTTAGKRSNPFSGDVFERIKYSEIWTCGWVDFESADGLKFVTQGMAYFGDIIVDGEIKVLGSRENPFTSSVYQEMENDGIWSGGWVNMGSATPVYIGQSYSGNGSNSNSGSGSGCGNSTESGSGSGSGSDSGSGDVIAGADYVNIIADDVQFQIRISWEAGLAAPGGGGISTELLSIYTTSTGNVDVTTSTYVPSAVWIGLYTMTVSIAGSSITYSIPDIFRN